MGLSIVRAGVENGEMVEALGYRLRLVFVGVFIAGSAIFGKPDYVAAIQNFKEKIASNPPAAGEQRPSNRRMTRGHEQ